MLRVVRQLSAAVTARRLMLYDTVTHRNVVLCGSHAQMIYMPCCNYIFNFISPKGSKHKNKHKG